MGDYVQSSLNFGVEVTASNRSIDFKISGGGAELQATLRVGLYSITSLIAEVQRALTAADNTNTYTLTVDRSISGGTANRLTIATSGAFLSVLLATGTRAASSAASLLGFPAADQTGATSYTGTGSVGTLLVPTYPPQSYQPLGSIYDARRSVNDSTSGRIETVSFTTFRNFQFQFKWIAEDSSEYTGFQSFHIWLLRGGPIEFVPKITVSATVAVGVPINLRTPLELNRMIPQFYDYFETPVFTFREQI